MTLSYKKSNRLWCWTYSRFYMVTIGYQVQTIHLHSSTPAY